MNISCIADLSTWLCESRQVDHLELTPELCPPDMTGDLTVNCFKLTKPLKCNPMQLAGQVVEWLEQHDDVAAAEAIKAFVNITLTDAALYRDTIADAAALLADVQLPEADRKRYLIEFSAPNTNKPQHLGHVRNNTLGQANCGLLSRVGHDVVPVNLVNDRGIHICKSMIAYQREGNGVTPESAGKKGDHLVGDFYVKYNAMLAQQLKALRASQPELAEKTDDQLFLQTEIGAATQQMLVDWENGDTEVRALWRQMNDWVLAGFQQTYDRMGIEYARTYFESDTYTLGRDIVNEGLEKGVFYKRDDGAVEIDLTKEKLDKKVVLRSDGTTVYITQDLGTTLLKYDDFQPDGMIWVVGDEQIYHFRVLFAILQKLGYDWAHDLHHLAYGMVNLPEGKMKSREGTVVDADNLFDEVRDLAQAEIAERWPELPEDEVAERAETIGMAALKFMLLKVNPKTTMTFNPKESVSFVGDTGPYLLYAYARIASIQRKADEEIPAEVDWSLLSTPEERALALLLSNYANIMQQAADNLDPSKVIDYLINLAREFSRFYKEHSVLNADTAELRQARLALCDRVRTVLGDALDTLTIGTVESM